MGDSHAVLPPSGDLVIIRIIDAPPALVFRAWTDPDHLVHWWGPKGFTTPFCEVDLRPGGVFRYCMRSPEGQEYWGIAVYREIVAPERIVYIDSFADPDGNVASPEAYGLSADHPVETTVSVTFEEVEGKTRLTLHHAIHDTFPEFDGTHEGWTQMLDRLAEVIAVIPAP